MASRPSARFPRLFQVLEIIVIFLAVGLVNTSALIGFRQFPEVDNYSDDEGWYVVGAIVNALLILLILKRNGLMASYAGVWRKNRFFFLFLVYASLSILWSVYVPATLYKLVFLFLSTIVGSYIAVRCHLREVINVLSWIGGFFTALSLAMVVFLPVAGVMQNEPFVGSWTGIFWHRNHTGNLFAFFNAMFLIRLLMEPNSSIKKKGGFAIFYLLTALMVFGSRSATGIIVFLFLHLVAALIFGWLKYRQRLRAWHYAVAATALLGGFFIFITNTAFFFGLLGRTPTMTGRIPLWIDIFQHAYLRQPIVGYGYGALWMLKGFRIEMQLRHGWPYQVYFADNGFFDILLNLGVVGLALFLAVYLPFGFRALKQGILSGSGIAFLPFVTFLYVFVGNLTYSFLLEVDQFVWMLLVIMIFLTSSQSSNRIAQP